MKQPHWTSLDAFRRRRFRCSDCLTTMVLRLQRGAATRPSLDIIPSRSLPRCTTKRGTHSMAIFELATRLNITYPLLLHHQQPATHLCCVMNTHLQYIRLPHPTVSHRFPFRYSFFMISSYLLLSESFIYKLCINSKTITVYFNPYN
jgi:hypothetical protein